MARMDELWKAVDGPGTPPMADSRAVKARVNAALDVDRNERRSYRKQKLWIVIAAAALAAALTGCALAVTGSWDMIQVFFQGDTAPAREYVDSTVRSVRDENYTLTVESSMADENNTVYLIVTLTANQEETREFLFSDDFHWAAKAISVRSAEQAEAPAYTYGYSARIGELEAPDESSRRFQLAVQFDPSESVSALLVGSGYMDRECEVEVPVTPAPSVTVELGASGTGIPHPDAAAPGTLTIERATLSPFTCRIECTCVPLTDGCQTSPRVFFRMADGSIRTQAQMMELTRTDGGGDETGGGPAYGRRYDTYKFDEVQDLADIVSLIAFDVEYPLDGSAPTRLEHDPALDPFNLPAMEPLAERYGYSLSAQALTEGLGGTCDQDPVTAVMTCAFRDVAVVLRPGDITALVNGQPVTMIAAPAMQNGSLAVSPFLLEDAWGIDCIPVGGSWNDWYIIP